MKKVILAAVAISAAISATAMAGTVEVTPNSMGAWTLNSFDSSGTIVNSGAYFGTAAMVPGPGAPPLGTGSAELATPTGFGDGAAAIATEQFDNVALSSITSLSYSAYDQTNNGSQFPYLTISINTDPGQSDNALDTLFFEPPYQQPTTGNSTLPNQGAPVKNEWQTWNAYVGGYWDNNGIGNPGTPEPPSKPVGVMPLSAFLTAYPNATIGNGGYPGLGGIALQVGFASGTAVGYVDNFTIGINNVDTTYDFDPNATATPLPSAAGMGLAALGVIGAAGLLRRKLHKA